METLAVSQLLLCVKLSSRQVNHGQLLCRISNFIKLGKMNPLKERMKFVTCLRFMMLLIMILTMNQRKL